MANFTEIFVAIAAEPWLTVVEFYQALLSCEPTTFSPNRYGEFQVRGLKLGIFKPSAQHSTEFDRPAGALSLCLEVENLAMAIATVEQLGGTVQRGITQASHGDECYAYDPVGNRLILHQGKNI
ncbi:glyoxalase [Synechococcus moorigangaii CMS01]|nr:glyoxalase [Synechococcus moorigangaii CMS01]